MTSPTKFYHTNQIILKMWLCQKRLVTIPLVTDTRYGLGTLQQCGKSVKTNFLKIFRGNSYFFRSYRRKTGSRGGGGVSAPHPTLP